MTHYVNIIIFVLMFLALGLKTKAQSTARMPYEGATHTYTVDGISVGAKFDYYVTSDIGGANIIDGDGTGEFNISVKTGDVGGDGLASTAIKWNGGTASNIYYLWVDAYKPGGCSNKMFLQITPQVNQFDLLVENSPDKDLFESCPETLTAQGFDADADVYSHGTTTLEFKVKRVNGTDNTLTAAAGDTYDWSFIPDLTVDPTLSGKINAIFSVVTATKSGDRYIVSGEYDEVIVTVEVENAPGYDLDVTLDVTDQKEYNTNLTDSDPLNDEVTHTIKVMPKIIEMGGV